MEMYTNTDRSTARNGHQWALMILGKATDKYKYKMNTIADTYETMLWSLESNYHITINSLPLLIIRPHS